MTFQSALSRRGLRFSTFMSVSNKFQEVSSRLQNVTHKIKNYEAPEKFKGTFIERWGRFWKHLYLDYLDTAVSISKDCRERPIRTLVYCSIVGCFYYLAKKNPDEILFREQLLQDTARVMLVPESLRNPKTVEHVTRLHEWYNEGTVRILNLGIISLIWIDNYDGTLSLYKTVCPYLKPQYLTFYKRIVDVGFLEKWWILEKKMKDYDINEEEYGHLSTVEESESPWNLRDVKKKLLL